MARAQKAAPGSEFGSCHLLWMWSRGILLCFPPNCNILWLEELHISGGLGRNCGNYSIGV